MSNNPVSYLKPVQSIIYPNLWVAILKDKIEYFTTYDEALAATEKTYGILSIDVEIPIVQKKNKSKVSIF